MKYDLEQIKKALKEIFPYSKRSATHALEWMVVHANSCDAEDCHVKALLNLWLEEVRKW